MRLRTAAAVRGRRCRKLTAKPDLWAAERPQANPRAGGFFPHGKESGLTRDLENLEQKIGVPSGALPACFDAAFGLEITDEVEGEAADDGHVLGAVAGAVAR